MDYKIKRKQTYNKEYKKLYYQQHKENMKDKFISYLQRFDNE